jgi:hypothetical protein
LTVDFIRELRDLTVSQLGRVRMLKGGRGGGDGF